MTIHGINPLFPLCFGGSSQFGYLLLLPMPAVPGPHRSFWYFVCLTPLCSHWHGTLSLYRCLLIVPHQAHTPMYVSRSPLKQPCTRLLCDTHFTLASFVYTYTSVRPCVRVGRIVFTYQPPWHLGQNVTHTRAQLNVYGIDSSEDEGINSSSLSRI